MRVELEKDVMIRELEGESILLNSESGQYFGLDDVGTRMLTLLMESSSLDDALETLMAEYDVSSEQLQRDAAAFVDSLVEHGLVRVEDPS